MPIGKDYRLVRGEGSKAIPPTEDREGATWADLSPAPAAVHSALTLIPGADEILEQVPGLKDFIHWAPTVYFSVCAKSGTRALPRPPGRRPLRRLHRHAGVRRRLPRLVLGGRVHDVGIRADENRAGQLLLHRTHGRRLPLHRSAAELPDGERAQVECLIDSFSFGPLPFSGTMYQPHPCDLAAGGRDFRIRQMSGSFFLSLTVWKV